MRGFQVAPECEAALQALEQWQRTGGGRFPTARPSSDDAENTALYTFCLTCWNQIQVNQQAEAARIAALAHADAAAQVGSGP